LKLKHTKEAIRDFTYAIQVDPEDYIFYYNRAHALLILNLYSNAIADFKKITVYLEKNFPSQLFSQESQDQSLNQPQATDKTMTRKKQVNLTVLSLSYYYLGYCYFHQEKWKEAKANLEQFLKINPNPHQPLLANTLNYLKTITKKIP
jgi:tetratricopeptide (TPR) repeat protein